MGDHYLPQYYLSGFCELQTPGLITRYEKGIKEIITTNISNVAQENNYYSKEVETILANEIEEPANLVIKKIREYKNITFTEKYYLSVYIVALLKRVPESKLRMKRLAPQALETVFSQINITFDNILKDNPSDSERIDKRRQEANAIRRQLEKTIPKEIWLQDINPYSSPRTLGAISSMNWRFLINKKDSSYLTSDNPVYYHYDIGVGHMNSEVTFPISKNIILWATWKNDKKEGYYPANNKFIIENNRRTASTATRYLFFSRKEEWIVNLVNKSKYNVHHLV